MLKLEKLYKIDSLGKLREWTSYIDGDSFLPGDFFSDEAATCNGRILRSYADRFLPADFFFFRPGAGRKYVL